MNVESMAGDDDLRAAIEGALGRTDDRIATWTSTSMDDAEIEAVAGSGTEVIVVGPSVPTDVGLWVARAIDERHPWISVLLITNRTTEVLERALRSGAAGIIDPGATGDEVSEAIEAAKVRSRRRHDQLGLDHGSRSTNRVVPVLAAKGGVGKSMLATNLAHALASMFPGEVVIVDGDIQFGDVTSNLGVDPSETMSGTLRFGADLDATTLKAFLTPVGPSGELFVLPAPLSPAQADDLTASHFGNVLRLLHQEFRYVVIDTSAGIDEITLEALDVATDLVVMTSMDVPSVRAATKELDALRMLGMEHLEWHVVLNRANAKVGLSVDDIEATLGRRISAQIPSTRAIPVSVNKGEPLVIYDPRLPASKAILALAATIAGVEEHRSGLKKWRSGR